MPSKSHPETVATGGKHAEVGSERFPIRCFSARDEFERWRNALAELYAEAYRDLREYAYRQRPQILSYLDWLYRGDPELFLVAWNRAGQPIGFISSHRHWMDEELGDVGNIHEMAVHPHYRGLGVGRALFQRTLERLAQEHDTVILWVGEKNIRAKAMYERRGFEEIGRHGKWIKMKRSFSRISSG